MTGQSSSHTRAFTVVLPCGLLDFLLENVKGKSRNNIKSLLSHKQIRVDGVCLSQFDHPLRPGQTVTVPLSAQPIEQKLPFQVIFEDKELLVIDKPAGLLTMSTDREKELTAYHIVMNYVRAKNPANRIYIIHRLDRDTSGVLVFAKNEEMKRAFQDKWSELVKKRGYLALVEGILKQKNGTVRSWLQETSTHLVYSGSIGDGKEAITHYTVLKENSAFSLLDVAIDTGRKNQIRVHMKDLGHPIVGDKKYGSTSNPLGRMGLHAHQLALKHPVTGLETVFTAKIPTSFHSPFKSSTGNLENI